MKTFADGILVHKDYIWPVGKNLYVQPPTILVKYAHNVGLVIMEFFLLLCHREVYIMAPRPLD